MKRQDRFWRKEVAAVMAKVIEFYIPDGFRKKRLWIPSEHRGKVIEFPSPEKKTA